jgi:ribosomal protein S6E (S10)
MEGSLVAYKVFSNGSVLNASEINDNLMNQSIAVFTNAAARTAAISSPVEGQMTYLEDLNVYQSFDGLTWSSPFALTLVKTQTIGTAVSTVTVTNAFSDEFESYKIIITGGVASQNQNMRLQMTGATTGYYAAGQNVTYAGVSSAVSGNNISLWGFVGYGSTNTLAMNADVTNPFQAKRTFYSSPRSAAVAGTDFIFGGGFLDNNNSYTDFTITPAGGTYTGGTIYVYGYKKA